MPGRLKGETPGFGQVTEARGKLKLEPLLGFRRERQGRAEKHEDCLV